MAQFLDTPQGPSSSQALFMALAEELKLPMQQVARKAELGLLKQAPSAAELQGIQTTADMALHLLDSYLLSLRIAIDPQEMFEVEPMGISAVLHDAAEQLARVADEYGVVLELHTKGKYEPVMVHRQAFSAAFVSLGYTLIEALPAMGTQQLRLQLAAHHSRSGIVAGMYCDAEALNPSALRQASALKGRARQPLVGVSPSSGAGVFVADTILHAMDSRLRVGRYQKLPGFAVTLPVSQQLTFV